MEEFNFDELTKFQVKIDPAYRFLDGRAESYTAEWGGIRSSSLETKLM